MKQVVLARPNLKLFLLGAILVLVVDHFVSDGHSEGPMIVTARSADPAGGEALLSSLLAKVHEKPTADLCNQLSSIYESRGDFRKAIVYLRQAEILAEFED